MSAIRRLGSLVIFLLIAGAAYVAAFYVRGVLATADSPDALAGAIVIDLVFVVPVGYYFLVVRRFGLPAISVAGVFILSLIAATQIIPDDYQRILTPLEILAGVAELALLSFIAWHAVRGVRRIRAATAGQQGGDAFDAIRTAARQAVDSERVADMLGYEMAIMYYGLGTWRQQLAPGAGRYTSYKLNNYGSTFFGIGVLLVVELIGVHLLVQHYWSTAGAWILSILTAYAGIWLMGDWHAQRLRPTLITADALVLRAGLRWEIVIPFERIQSFRRVSAIEEKPRGALNLVAFGDPLFEVTTAEPVTARGAYGISKPATCIWFTIDEPADFQEKLAACLPGGEDRPN